MASSIASGFSVNTPAGALLPCHRRGIGAALAVVARSSAEYWMAQRSLCLAENVLTRSGRPDRRDLQPARHRGRGSEVRTRRPARPGQRGFPVRHKRWQRDHSLTSASTGGLRRAALRLVWLQIADQQYDEPVCPDRPRQQPGCGGGPVERGVRFDHSAQGAGMTVTGIISAIIVGLIIGALGRLVVRGRQPIPIWLTIVIVIGIVAAFIGSFIAGALGYANSNGGIPWILLILQIIVAAIGVVIAANLYARRGTTRRP
jgi:uncharacterized membrane protein YeaQ/YmgE (transglycosylase-associated protein family)